MTKRVFLGFMISIALLLSLAAGVVYGGGAERLPVFVGFTHQPGPNEEALVRGAGGTLKYTYHLVPAISASLTEEAIQGLLHNPNVAYIEPDIEVRIVNHPAGDAELDNAWGVVHIGSGAVHAGGNKGATIKVGILDSGIDTDHPDLSYDPNCSYGTSYGTVEGGHGTHTAGTVAALDNGTGVVGVAPEVTLCIYKVLSDSGGGFYSDIVAAVERAVADGVQVTNNSYGSDGDPGATVKAAFDNAYAAGMLHAAAAGNAGNPPGKGDNCIYPARWDSLIATAATTESDSWASFSSTCPEMELAAPGYQVNSTTNDGGYGTKSGTSMASPHVAGTAALVLAANFRWTNDQVRTQLQTTADDLGKEGRDEKYGYGLVDAAAASGSVNNPPTVSITGSAVGSNFDSGATILFEGTGSDTEDGDIRASLVWTSDIDGQIGTGGSFSTTLSDGNHTVTASVADSGGVTGSDAISIIVGTPSPSPTLSVAIDTDKASYVNKEILKITHTVTDGTSPVENAGVSSVITTAKGRTLSAVGKTDANGVLVLNYKVNSKRDGVGTYTVDATASKGGFTSGSASSTFEVTE